MKNNPLVAGLTLGAVALALGLGGLNTPAAARNGAAVHDASVHHGPPYYPNQFRQNYEAFYARKAAHRRWEDAVRAHRLLNTPAEQRREMLREKQAGDEAAAKVRRDWAAAHPGDHRQYPR